MYRLLIALHLLGASIWIGGHILLTAVILPQALRRRDPAIVLNFENGFERIALPALLVQVVTGLWLAYFWLPRLSAWFTLDTSHSRFIVAKLVLLAATIVLALNARLRVIPRLNSANLNVIAYHIVAVTLLSLGLLLAGVGIRTGGLF